MELLVMFMVFCLLVPIVLMVICISNTDPATNIATEKLKNLSKLEIQERANSKTEQIIFKDYFSRERFSEIILVSMCKSEIKNKDKN